MCLYGCFFSQKFQSCILCLISLVLVYHFSKTLAVQFMHSCWHSYACMGAFFIKKFGLVCLEHYSAEASMQPLIGLLGCLFHRECRIPCAKLVSNMLAIYSSSFTAECSSSLSHDNRPHPLLAIILYCLATDAPAPSPALLPRLGRTAPFRNWLLAVVFSHSIMYHLYGGTRLERCFESFPTARVR